MSEKRDDGGPIFPFVVPLFDKYRQLEVGMTLRDYFAAHAPFVIEDILYTHDKDQSFNPREKHLELLAEMRYKYADAMIVERNK